MNAPRQMKAGSAFSQGQNETVVTATGCRADLKGKEAGLLLSPATPCGKAEAEKTSSHQSNAGGFWGSRDVPISGAAENQASEIRKASDFIQELPPKVRRPT